MAKIKFLTDSASDITEELEKKLDIQIMNFKVAMGDDSYTSRIDFDNEKFYKSFLIFKGCYLRCNRYAVKIVKHFVEFLVVEIYP